MHRQIDADPTSFHKGGQKQTGEEHKGEHHEDSLREDLDLEGDGRQGKRKAIDKQQAFLEYKQQQEDGVKLEKAIMDYRNDMNYKRNSIKTFTQVINATKTEMDHVKSRLDQKQDEKKAQMGGRNDEFSGDGFGDDDGNGQGNEEIIDEEELMLLKEMKDLKKNYRENYDKLKNYKVEVNDCQSNIDQMKQ